MDATDEFVEIQRATRKKETPIHILRYELKTRPAMKAFVGSKKALRKRFSSKKKEAANESA